MAVLQTDSKSIFHYLMPIDIISNVIIFIVKYNQLLWKDG
jgi:hypothetical protein